MIDKIIPKSIKKAQKNGFKNNYTEWELMEYPELLLFDHAFAKAYFGEGKVDRWNDDFFEELCLWKDTEMGGFNVRFIGSSWQFHLQQLIILETFEEQLKYLEKFL